jgi:hypothetical protein
MSTPSTRTTVWAAAGETTAPDAGAIATGFVAGAKPSRRKFNWLFGWLDNAVQWLLAWGVALYKSDVDYAANARVIFGGRRAHVQSEGRERPVDRGSVAVRRDEVGALGSLGFRARSGVRVRRIWHSG